ncbi:hypothetical protein GCM10028778_18070 [Barrientosiimonas marina]|uniref:Amino acid adenylation domain-containing protein n=1 Tax=Lentibacillus kimchii TaxID=1542911 RepID=A0ABW2UUH4_9BACI
MYNIIQEFRDIAKKKPKQTALIDDSNSYSYEQVEKYTNYLADHFQNELGIKREQVVPLFMKPSNTLILTILALYKAGAAYLPISIKFPQDRINFLIEDSKSDIVLTNTNIDCQLSKINYINVNSITIQRKESFTIVDSNLAYIIYTSGSTGNPKGVCVSQDNLSHILRNMQKYYPVNTKDRYLLTTPYTFDVSVAEIFGWIKGQGSLVISSFESTSDFKKIVPYIGEYGVTHMAVSPSILEVILNTSTNKELDIMNDNLKYLMVAGEEFKVSLVSKVLDMLPNVETFNLYGPTENTIYTTHYKISNKNEDINSVPIGKELDDVKVHLLRDDFSKCDFGEIGELYISGEGVAQGYAGKEDLTKANFIEYKNDERYYKTGDLGYRDYDGNIYFKGRIDNQVQINGIRIELGEIESLIEKNIREIKFSKVIYENKKLYCFYIPHFHETLKKTYLKEKLQNIMPSYMVPNILQEVEEFPFNVNGKIDIQKLLQSTRGNGENENDKNEVLSENEEKIRTIFSNILNSSNISKFENFFDLGGDSLDNIQAIISIEEEFSCVLDDDFMYNYPTVKEIGSYFGDSNKNIGKAEFTNGLIEDTISDIERTIEVNNSLINTSKQTDKHGTYYYQKAYIHHKFDSNIEVEMKVKKSREIGEIVEAIRKIISNNLLLRCTLDFEGEGLYFKEFCDLDQVRIPVYDINETDSLKEIKDTIHENLSNNHLNSILHQPVIIFNGKEFNVVWVLSHNIADFSNVHVLKSQFHKILRNEDYKDNNGNYFDFIEYISENNERPKEVLDYDITKQIDRANKIDDWKEKVNSGLTVLRYANNTQKSSNETINEINYYTSKLLLEQLGENELSFRSIFNIRSFEKFDFNSELGDFHSSITFPAFKAENYTDYLQRINNILDLYKTGFNPMYTAYKDYPFMNDYQSKLSEIYDKNPILQTNYLGNIKGNELYETIKSLNKTLEQLEKFPINRIYVTAFTTQGFVYLVFLTNPNFGEKILTDNGIEVLSLEKDFSFSN